MSDKEFKCIDCGKEFDVPKTLYTSYESYFGVSSLFQDKHPLKILVCPSCDSCSFIKNNESEEEENEI